MLLKLNQYIENIYSMYTIKKEKEEEGKLPRDKSIPDFFAATII